jgi:hypothetical protein
MIPSLLFMTGCATTPSSKPDESLSSELIKLKTRLGVTQKFLLIKSKNPIATVVLLEGGPGILKLSSFMGKPLIERSKGFLARSRKEFVKHGFMVALLDAPSDRASEGMTPTFRIGNEYAQDMKAVVSYLKQEENIPLWLVGMSLGSFSAPNGAIRIKEGVDGLILASSVSSAPKRREIAGTHPNGILDMDLARITVPTLITAHKNDKCKGSSPSGAPKIKKALINAPVAEIKYFTGSKLSLTWECGPLSPHGYYGIEDQIISAIAEFIKSVKF